ncbi:hypothetical protein F443_10900 [Phytophthora nicotianae P1569]|uniref:DDE-1 domain-containing protein n=1 Tax=Phytophthora nicotianae P1569 TaxID=1317065 RepID=V9EZZ6_PHYNI|nr:hypothetical protein F443_10900 [Phytophthora nicotianae P1569]
MCVIPGGLTPYLQAGHIGIYKSFKDVLYMEINTQKDSDKVEYTQVDNPRMPSVGFADNWMDWHVARQDLYGEQFRAIWELRGERNEEHDGFNLDELQDGLDDIALIGE